MNLFQSLISLFWRLLIVVTLEPMISRDISFLKGAPPKVKRTGFNKGNTAFVNKSQLWRSMKQSPLPIPITL